MNLKLSFKKFYYKLIFIILIFYYRLKKYISNVYIKYIKNG